MYETEKNIIKKYLDEDLYHIFRESDAILAGGAVTSIFTNREINDWDIYFKTKEGFSNFLRESYGFNKDNILDGNRIARVTHTTDRSILINSESNKIQLVIFKLFPTIEDIFNSFDFTINMGAYDFKTEEFVLHNDFLKHNSQRYLKINTNTDYPLISTIRIQKYVERGYTISKSQMLRLLLAVNKKNIDSWEVFIDEVNGMYGLEPKEIFDTTKDFSLESAIEQLDQIFLPSKFKNLDNQPEFQDLVKKYNKFIDNKTLDWIDSNKEKWSTYSWSKFDNSEFYIERNEINNVFNDEIPF